MLNVELSRVFETQQQTTISLHLNQLITPGKSVRISECPIKQACEL